MADKQKRKYSILTSEENAKLLQNRQTFGDSWRRAKASLEKGLNYDGSEKTIGNGYVVAPPSYEELLEKVEELESLLKRKN